MADMVVLGMVVGEEWLTRGLMEDPVGLDMCTGQIDHDRFEVEGAAKDEETCMDQRSC